MSGIGPVTKHIKASSGGETYALKHYCTTNENSYGSGWEHFTPRCGAHSGAGYMPNNRGQIFYTSHLDVIDNPKIGITLKGSQLASPNIFSTWSIEEYYNEIIKTNYKSITQKDYNGFKIPNGTETLPLSTLYQPSGFVREPGVHIPTEIQLQSQFINGLLQKSPANIPGKHKPLLYQTYPKDPVMLENSGYGPFYMSTEYKTQYDGKQCRDLGPGRIGNLEMTGFTENNKTEEPLEGRPDACMCNHEAFGNPPYNCRPTGHSIYTTHYRPLGIPNGREPLPNIETRAAISNGFTKGNKAVPDFVEIHPDRVYDKASDMTEARLEWIRRNDPAEYINAINCNRIPTMMNAVYQGKQIQPIGNCDFRTKTGNLEVTGHISNQDIFVQTRDKPERFITNSMTQFYDPSLAGSERNGHINGQVQPTMENGFSREVKLHKIEPQMDALTNSSKFTPYQSRSIIARESISISPTKMPA